MNKKFSTLLAAALVAGGLGSSAFADTPIDLNKRIQLTLLEGGTVPTSGALNLIVGESSTRDSLALAGDPESIYDSHKQNWQLTLTPKKDGNGFTTKYDVYLENQVNGAVALTNGDGTPRSFYYSPGAVVASGKKYLFTVDASKYNAKTNELTLTDAQLVVKFGSSKYDASSKTKTQWILYKENDVIKQLAGTFKFTAQGKPADSDEINRQPVNFEVERVDATSDLQFKIVQKTDGDVVTGLLNKVGNESFQLTFSNEVTSGSEFGNALSATELSVVSSIKVLSAAKYPGLTAYNNKVTDAKGVINDIVGIKTDLQSFAKEMEVALTAVVETSGTLEDNAPNKADVATTKEMLAPTKILTVLKDAGQAQAKAISDLLTTYAPSGYSYSISNEDGYEVEDASKTVKELNEAVKKITDELDKLVANATTALDAINATAQAFVKENYQKANITEFEYEKVKIADKDEEPSAYLKALADDNLATAKATTLKAVIAVPDYTKSQPVGVPADYSPFAVVGQEDTYVAVDTVYVAEREKYLAVGTMKMDKYAIVRSTVTGEFSYKDKKYEAGDIVPIESEADFEENKTSLEYVLVPALGKYATNAFFKAVNYDDVISVAEDSLVITALAPKDPSVVAQITTPDYSDVKYYKDYEDASTWNESTSCFYEAQVVIRTLGGGRELSVLTASEDGQISGNDYPEVCENTRISFEEPALATLVKDGAIYFIINKEVKEENNYGKYYVATPNNTYNEYAKEAYKNVPGTQWIVEKNNDKYRFENRDFNASRFGNQKLYVVGDEADMIYTTVDRDTFQLVELTDVEKEGHLGYKYISEEIQKISQFALSAVNYANMETPYYLAFNANEDSILTTTSNKEEALALIPMIVDGKQVTEEYKMNDENLTKQYYQFITKDGKDTLYLTIGDENMLVVTKVAPEVTETTDKRLYLQFRSINDEPNAYEVLLGYFNGNNYYAANKLSYNQDGEAVAVAANTASAFVYDLVDNSTDIYKNFGFEGSTKVIISLNGDAESKVTKIGPFATVKRTGLDETIDADYSLIMDTAYVDHKDNIRYAYYITKPIVAADTAWNAEKFYMVSYADSLARENDTIKYSQDGLTRIGFVAAKRLGTDSLAITKAVGAAAADTLNVTEKLGVTNATFAFAIDENNEEAYRIEVAPAKYVSYLNGILVEGAKEQAQLFNVNATDLTPTENEEISVEDGVQVIGGKGAVTVQGAAGKTVTVYNFQGRALASTTLTSDNQTIAVPAGLVAVSVEGEPEAISVVVK